MDLYFSPLACSLATRIALYEAGAQAGFIQVDTKSKRLSDGSDFYPISPLGQVPVLRTGEGWLLSENTAILPYVADRYPAARLAPAAGTAQRARLQQWLGFISTELHKAVFVPLLDARAPEEVKRYARDKASLRLGVLQDHLAHSEYLLDGFSVGDAYLVTVLNWASYGGIDLSQWPTVAEYYKRLMRRPSVAKAAAEEIALFEEEVARRAKS
jgi:glutathione S-transferase